MSFQRQEPGRQTLTMWEVDNIDDDDDGDAMKHSVTTLLLAENIMLE